MCKIPLPKYEKKEEEEEKQVKGLLVVPDGGVCMEEEEGEHEHELLNVSFLVGNSLLLFLEYVHRIY